MEFPTAWGMRAWVIASACVQSNSDVSFSAHLELGPRHSSPAILLKDNIFKNLEDHEVTATLFHTPMCRYGQWVRLCVDKRIQEASPKALEASPSSLQREARKEQIMTWFADDSFFFGCFVCVTAWVCVHHRSSFSMATCDSGLFVSCFFLMGGPMLHHGECGAGDSDLMWSEFWITGSCLLMTVKTSALDGFEAEAPAESVASLCLAQADLFVWTYFTINFMAESMSPIKLQLWGVYHDIPGWGDLCDLPTSAGGSGGSGGLHPVLRHPVLLMVYGSIYQWYIKICFDNFLMFLGWVSPNWPWLLDLGLTPEVAGATSIFG